MVCSVMLEQFYDVRIMRTCVLTGKFNNAHNYSNGVANDDRLCLMTELQPLTATQCKHFKLPYMV